MTIVPRLLRRLVAAAIVGIMLAPTATSAAIVPGNIDIALTSVASGLSSPLLVTHAGDGSNRLFVVEQTGKVRIVKGGNLQTAAFIDISRAVSRGGEQGLLGLAFHPSFESNRKLYLSYTDLNGTSVIREYTTLASNPDRVDGASGRTLLRVKQPYENHNGGHLAFGPDGYLYIGLGDGGSGGDPGNRAQNRNSLLGKLLRIDVNKRTGTLPYAIPSTNPYVGRTGLDQIWAFGLRNPWRFSFDRATGDLWIGDVGQGVVGRGQPIGRDQQAECRARRQLRLAGHGRCSLLHPVKWLRPHRQDPARHRIQPWRRPMLDHGRPCLSWHDLSGPCRCVLVRRLLLWRDLVHRSWRVAGCQTHACDRYGLEDHVARGGRGRRGLRHDCRGSRLPGQ